MRDNGYHHGALPQAIIEASLELIAEHGLEGFSLAKAAKAAGVSAAAPYRHFANKAALLGAIAVFGFERLSAALRAAKADRQDDPVAELLDLGSAYIDFVITNPALAMVMFSTHDRPPQSAAGQEALGVLGEVLGRLHHQGRLTVPVDVALRATWATVHGVAVLHAGGMRTFQDNEGPAAYRQILRPLLDGGLLTAPDHGK